MVNVSATKDSAALIVMISTSANPIQSLFVVTTPLVITILVDSHVFAGLVMKNMNPNLAARTLMSVHVTLMTVVIIATAQTSPVTTIVHAKLVSNLSMTPTVPNAMILMNAKLETITVMPTLLVPTL